MLEPLRLRNTVGSCYSLPSVSPLCIDAIIIEVLNNYSSRILIIPRPITLKDYKVCWMDWKLRKRQSRFIIDKSEKEENNMQYVT